MRGWRDGGVYGEKLGWGMRGENGTVILELQIRFDEMKNIIHYN